jgi:hypothetical protein
MPAHVLSLLLHSRLLQWRPFLALTRLLLSCGGAARIGSQVVVPYRGVDDEYRHLKPMGDLGQVRPPAPPPTLLAPLLLLPSGCPPQACLAPLSCPA